MTVTATQSTFGVITAVLNRVQGLTGCGAVQLGNESTTFRRILIVAPCIS